MISRLMLSVRKAASADDGWESYTRVFTLTTGDDPHGTVRFAPNTRSPTDVETINLDYLPHPHR